MKRNDLVHIVLLVHACLTTGFQHFTSHLENRKARSSGLGPHFSAVATQRETDDSPAIATENDKFECDEWVEKWRNFEVPKGQELEMIGNIIQPYLTSGDAQARAYWLYHAARVGYFTANAVAGIVAHRIHQTIIQRNAPKPITNNYQSDELSTLASATIVESLKSMDQNYQQVQAGILNYPWDAALRVDSKDSGSIQWNFQHKQSNPLFAAQETLRLIQDSVGVLGRRDRLQGEPAGVWMQGDKSSYPSYYLNDFHYQQDGWLSSVSAERYEVSTETLFVGRQDSMQRQTLVPIRKRYKTAPPESMLEVACGTGRYATFARDNFPTTDMTLVDLSPFYLEKARDHDAYWRKNRGADALRLAGSSQTTAPPAAQFVQANAEHLPFPDDSFEVVTTVYLFHELPHEARVQVARELARVCKPGGMVVFTDSFQTMDTDRELEGFVKLNEPHYGTYLREDLPALFEAQGLECGEKYVNSRTKTLTFYKK